MSCSLAEWSGLLWAGLCAGAGSAPETRPGVWISVDEVQRLPMGGEAWRSLQASAAPPLPTPDISGHDDNADVLCLAKALVFARTGEQHYRDEVVAGIQAAIGTERQGDVLALSRNLPGYVISAELVGLPPALESRFRDWLELVPNEELAGTTLRQIHERRPNNWGMHAGAARVVIARYLGNKPDVERVAKIFRGWLGDRSAYSSFVYGALDWQADAAAPVGINPRGATREGHSIDGVLPDDQRRSGGFTWPPPHENYVYEALQGALLQAMVLDRAGYNDVWEWGDRALLRSALWLAKEADFPAEGDDTWQPYVISHFYGADLALPVHTRPGKNIGWTDWTLSPFHARPR